MESDHPSHHVWAQREEKEVMGSALMNGIGDEAIVASQITQEGKTGQWNSGKAKRTGEVRNFWRIFVL